MKHFVAIFALILAGCTGAAGQCFLTFNPSSATATAAGGDAIFSVTPTMTPCQRTAVSGNPDWITVSFGQSSNGGTSTVGYTVKPNTTGQVRTGSISVNSTVFQITQAANVCTFAITPATQSVGVTGGAFSAKVETTCIWNATANVPWIGITSDPLTTGNGNLNYTVAPNPNLGSRGGTIQVGTAQLQITQFGTVCAYSISPVTSSVPAAGGGGQIAIQTDANCSWTATSSAPWIAFTTNAGTGAGAARFTAAANLSPTARIGNLIVAGQNAVVNQEGAGITFTAGSVVNGASFAAGPVAPGEIITIFGSGLGPTPGVALQLTPGGRSLTTALGGTRVLFDGVAAPMIYASDSQVSAVVPYSLTNAARTQLALEVQGVRSTAAGVDVSATSPAIFTAPSRGTGQGAVLNQDSSVNSVDNPAAAGSVVQIFATGEGQTLPAGMDGALAASPAPVPLTQPVTAQIAGIPAQVLYAGGAPGLVAGVFQVNVLVPATVRPGNAVPVVLMLGAAQSVAGVTIAIH
jgi:uncharacterized protein (TIGR03437 family)